ncbi:HAD family hydrolase [Campylobacter sputorum]|uniref:HAD family hydrolase n=1 Tax=Campylobacter sputorum TaxID=206 RepID=UPI00053BECE3|nr:HAD family hydrolase [Campylobacter sputorum]
MNNKIILFDMDGTLIDSTGAIHDGFTKAFKDNGDLLKLDYEHLNSLIGYPLDIMFERLGAPINEIYKYIHSYKEEYRNIYLKKTSLIDSARQAVELASSFAKLGIVTTKTSLYSKILLQHLEIDKYFDVVIGRDDVINPKPDSEPILKAINAINLKTNKVYMIGDTILDAKAAKAANVISIGLTCGYGSKDELCKYCDYCYDLPIDAVLFTKED